MRYPFIVCTLLSSLLLVTGCQKKISTEPHQTASEPSSTRPSSVQVFAATPQDAEDIAQFEKFNQDFHNMSQEMRDELQQLKQQGQLTPEFLAQRRHDRILSALNMLKDMELKTQQGHYIQGLMYSYWEERLKQSTNSTNAATSEPQPTTTHLMTQAEQQLDYWKSQQPQP